MKETRFHYRFERNAAGTLTVYQARLIARGWKEDEERVLPDEPAANTLREKLKQLGYVRTFPSSYGDSANVVEYWDKPSPG